MQLLTQTENWKMNYQLPDISLEEQNKYDKSKLVIKDQWSSHPNLKDRIDRLEQTGYATTQNEDRLSVELFKDIRQLQQQLTWMIFARATYGGTVQTLSADAFIESYNQHMQEQSFPKVFNSYYDRKNPVPFDTNQSYTTTEQLEWEHLFSNEKVDLVYTAIALQNDITTLIAIQQNQLAVKTFDYDGVKYNAADAVVILESLHTELTQTHTAISNNDLNIYHYFLQMETAQHRPARLSNMYQDFFSMDTLFDEYAQFTDHWQFLSVTTPFEQIHQNLTNNKPEEERFKQEMRWVLTDDDLEPEMTDAIRNSLDYYITNDWN